MVEAIIAYLFIYTQDLIETFIGFHRRCDIYIFLNQEIVITLFIASRIEITSKWKKGRRPSVGNWLKRNWNKSNTVKTYEFGKV